MNNTNLTLVINCGSSSLKFALLAEGERAPVLSGIAENLGQSDSRLTIRQNSGKTTTELDGGDHKLALKAILYVLKQKELLGSVSAVGHRVAHGGERFTGSMLADDEVIAGVEAISHLAPLHNPANILGIRIAREALPDVPHVLVFDTAFHATMAPSAYRYAIPGEFYERSGVRRYGFHGTSHRFVAREAVDLLELDPDNHGIIVAHLGNGASATAVHNGKSVDTTMGLTPLEGLVMGTRSGDIDAGAIFHIARQAGYSIDEMDTLLNRKSGLLGLSGLSNDCRTLESAAEDGHEGARLALDVFVHRLARYIGALAMALPRLDAVVFTGGIGENSCFVRAQTLNRLGPLGIELDPQENDRLVGGRSGIISSSLIPMAAVIATNEEWLIASDTFELAGKLRAVPAA